jgi:hypothetical protein
MGVASTVKTVPRQPTPRRTEGNGVDWWIEPDTLARDNEHQARRRKVAQSLLHAKLFSPSGGLTDFVLHRGLVGTWSGQALA